MVTLNDLERDFPEAYMHKKGNSHSEDTLRGQRSGNRESSFFAKSSGILAALWGANHSKVSKEFDQSGSN